MTSWSRLLRRGSDGLQDRSSDLGQRPLRIHSGAPEPPERVFLGQSVARHQEPLGTLDDLPVGQGLAKGLDLPEASQGEIEGQGDLSGPNGLDQARHDASFAGFVEEAAVRALGEQHNRTEGLVPKPQQHRAPMPGGLGRDDGYVRPCALEDLERIGRHRMIDGNDTARSMYGLAQSASRRRRAADDSHPPPW
jgi:hypothetical protein